MRLLRMIYAEACRLPMKRWPCAAYQTAQV